MHLYTVTVLQSLHYKKLYINIFLVKNLKIAQALTQTVMIMMIVEKEDGVDLEVAIENVLMIIQDPEDDQEVGHHDADKSIGNANTVLG